MEEVGKVEEEGKEAAQRGTMERMVVVVVVVKEEEEEEEEEDWTGLMSRSIGGP
jgi:hypothetical protein